jgi:hypothetical protein
LFEAHESKHDKSIPQEKRETNEYQEEEHCKEVYTTVPGVKEDEQENEGDSKDLQEECQVYEESVYSSQEHERRLPYYPEIAERSGW